jgi:hypothetical protein
MRSRPRPAAAAAARVDGARRAEAARLGREFDAIARTRAETTRQLQRRVDALARVQQSVGRAALEGVRGQQSVEVVLQPPMPDADYTVVAGLVGLPVAPTVGVAVTAVYPDRVTVQVTMPAAVAGASAGGQVHVIAVKHLPLPEPAPASAEARPAPVPVVPAAVPRTVPDVPAGELPVES